MFKFDLTKFLNLINYISFFLWFCFFVLFFYLRCVIIWKSSHLFRDSGSEDLEDLVVLDGELVAASEMESGCICVKFNSLGKLEGATEFWPIIVALVGVVAQTNVMSMSSSKDCTIICFTRNDTVSIVIEFFNCWIILILNIYDSENKGFRIAIFTTRIWIPWEICKASKYSVIGFNDGKSGALIIALLVEYLIRKAVDRSS